MMAMMMMKWILWKIWMRLAMKHW